jgi:hypothetical protein
MNGKETDPLLAALEAADWEGWEVIDGAGMTRVEVDSGIEVVGKGAIVNGALVEEEEVVVVEELVGEVDEDGVVEVEVAVVDVEVDREVESVDVVVESVEVEVVVGRDMEDGMSVSVLVGSAGMDPVDVERDVEEVAIVDGRR